MKKDSVYVRDKRSPKPTSDFVSKVMSANKAKNTKPELILRKALWKEKLNGYRLNVKDIPGRPDIVYTNRKIAIFVHGCFWHRCPYCNLLLPKNNAEFWEQKFNKNKERDSRKTRQLKKLGWKVLTIWECQINKNLQAQINKIRSIYNE